MLAALRVLFLLGFRTVNLLGVDFDMSAEKEKTYHFDEQRTQGAVRNNLRTYAALKKRFAVLQPIFLDHNFRVFNCNKASHLEVFPYRPFNEAVEEVSDFALGNPANERTCGLYAEDKIKAFQEGRDAGSDLPDQGVEKSGGRTGEHLIKIGPGITVKNMPRDMRFGGTGIRVIPQIPGTR